MNTAIFHWKGNRKSAELALPCDYNEDELAFSDRNNECVCVHVYMCLYVCMADFDGN